MRRLARAFIAHATKVWMKTYTETYFFSSSCSNAESFLVILQMNQTTTSPSTTPTAPTHSVTETSTTISLSVTSTTTTSTPTQPVTSTTTTSTPTQPVTSTTTTTSTAPSTTSLTTSTTATTSPLFCATALLCMPTAIYVINNNYVRTYNDVSGLLLGSLVNVQALAAVFQASSDIVGAYYDGTKINLIIGMRSYVYPFVYMYWWIFLSALWTKLAMIHCIYLRMSGYNLKKALFVWISFLL